MGGKNVLKLKFHSLSINHSLQEICFKKNKNWIITGLKSESFIWITRFENQYQKEESNPFRPVGVKYYSEKDLDTRTASEGEVENFPNNFGNGNSPYSPGWRQNVGLEFTITLYPFESHFIKVFSLFFVIGYLSQLCKKKKLM